jgi:outer membrane lipoprotein LolB
MIDAEDIESHIRYSAAVSSISSAYYTVAVGIALACIGRPVAARRLIVCVLAGALLQACVTTRPVILPVAWQARAAQLQNLVDWQLDGRAAVAIGSQGYQATLSWRQRPIGSEVRLAGPFGVGAMVVSQTPAGLVVNGAPPNGGDLQMLQDRLGFELPLNNLRYWLLGVPNPDAPFDLTRNSQDRAELLTQGGWEILYDRYAVVDGEWVPAHLVLTHAGTRVRVAVDHWTFKP